MNIIIIVLSLISVIFATLFMIAKSTNKKTTEKLSFLENEKKSVETDFSKLQEKYNDSENTVKTLKETCNNLDTKIAEDQKKIVDMNNTIYHLKKEIEVLTEKLKKIETEKSDLDFQYADSIKKISELEKLLAEKEKEISELESKLKIANANYKNAEDKLNAILNPTLPADPNALYESLKEKQESYITGQLDTVTKLINIIKMKSFKSAFERNSYKSEEVQILNDPTFIETDTTNGYNTLSIIFTKEMLEEVTKNKLIFVLKIKHNYSDDINKNYPPTSNDYEFELDFEKWSADSEKPSKFLVQKETSFGSSNNMLYSNELGWVTSCSRAAIWFYITTNNILKNYPMFTKEIRANYEELFNFTSSAFVQSNICDISFYLKFKK